MSQVIRVFFRPTWGYRPNLGAEKGSHMRSSDANQDGHWVYCRYIKRNGKIIYPKTGKVFKFWVNNK